MERPVENTQDKAGCITPVFIVSIDQFNNFDVNTDISSCDIETRVKVIRWWITGEFNDINSD